ncbi:unnamed protein product, partial [Staurois parvus]
MALEGVNIWGNQRVNCVLCVCFTVSTLFCMALLCRAMQSSVPKLTNSSPPLGDAR